MGLETATQISELNPDWPLGTDPKSAGDDHIRMIKQVLQDTFPIDGAPVYGFRDFTLTTSGTWNKPDDLKKLEVLGLVGAGGGSAGIGGTGPGTSVCGGGGGGGAVVQAVYTDPAELPETVNYLIGAGGTAGPGTGGAGGAGGASVFKLLTANGGTAGVPQSPSTSFLAAGSGSGGAAASTEPASVITRLLNGSRGAQGEQAAHNTASVAKPGGGGGNHFSVPDAQPYLLGAGSFGPSAGRFPGGGAGGCANSVSQPNRAGAVGAGGVLYLREWF